MKKLPVFPAFPTRFFTAFPKTREWVVKCQTIFSDPVEGEAVENNVGKGENTDYQHFHL